MFNKRSRLVGYAMIDRRTMEKILVAQKNEITEHLIYKKLSESINDKNNSKVLKEISGDELSHYKVWKKLSGKDVKPSLFNLWKYAMISRIFGITFGIKLMEKGEQNAQKSYAEMMKKIPEARKILADEDKHEKELIEMIDEERLRYVGSIVLGINDALVELTGALAGFTLAIQNAKLIAIMGLITGIAAALSMAASEFLSQTTDKGENPKKAAVYTGIVYMATVLFLVAPYFLFNSLYLSLASTIAIALVIIFLFTFYVSVAQDVQFKKRFLQMSFVSLGVAAITFCIGLFVRIFFNIQV